MDHELKALLPLAIRAVEEAGKEILSVYDSDDFQIEAKGDQSPLTQADRRAHDAIVEALRPSGIPILSEEGKSIPYEERKQWNYFWMVDPLDGTKEFIKRNGEFTVNIALIHEHTPVLGVVSVPVSGDLYYAFKGYGAWHRRDGNDRRLEKRLSVHLDLEAIRVVASRSHLNEQTAAFIGQLNNPQLVSKGSSLKFLLIASGEADVYPRYAPTMEWDTAAAHAIVNETGRRVLQVPGRAELQYNKQDLLNPSFLVI